MSTEEDSSQEGLDVSPISDTKWVTEFESETEHVKIGLWTQGRPTQNEIITADGRLKRGLDCSWTYGRHDQWFGSIDSKTTHGKTLLLNRMRDKWISQTDFKWWIEGVMFKSDTYCQLTQRRNISLSQIFPPPLLASTSLFLRKLEEDHMCL